jgi:dihydroorotase-like cyclic amidohydrolase
VVSSELRVFVFCYIDLWDTNNTRYSQHATHHYNQKAQIQSVFSIVASCEYLFPAVLVYTVQTILAARNALLTTMTKKPKFKVC